MNKEYLKDFIDKKCGGNKSDFTEHTGITYSSLINFLNSDKSDITLSTTTLKKILNKYPDFDFRRFIHEGTDFVEGVTVGEGREVLSPEVGIPFVPLRARAGYLHGYGDEVFLKSLEKMKIPGFDGDPFNKRIFQIQGDSMYPTLLSGDMVIAERVEREDSLESKHIYIIITRDAGMLIKRITERGDKIVIHSDNYAAGYAPDVIDKTEVMELWHALGKITTDLHRSVSLEREMDEIRSEYASMRGLMNKLL